MFRYKHEAAFSKALCTMLRRHGWFVQRIETGTTGRGVPDIYSVSPERIPVWLELKRVHAIVHSRDTITVPWREGQQAWLMNIVKQYDQLAYTLVCCDNVILRITHNKIYPENRVICCSPDIKAYTVLSDLII